MELGMVGLGRMGAAMAERLLQGGHRVAGFDFDLQARARLAHSGGGVHASLAELVQALPAPRVVWLMVPAGAATDSTVTGLLSLLAAGDTLIDGGNSHFADTRRRSAAAAERGVAFVDCGTSGGIWGLREGYSLMIGGDEAAVERLRPLFATLAPAPDRGWGRVGPVGAGHYVKMIHNGIEYGLMQAYAEGLAILQKERDSGFDLHQVCEIWRHGSVVRSWLLDLITDALAADPQLQGIAPVVADSGEGRWTVQEAMRLDVATPVIALSLLERFRSRDDYAFSDRLLAAMRNEFGGHAIVPSVPGVTPALSVASKARAEPASPVSTSSSSEGPAQSGRP
jgi:6-phosphogluconate dehydrogenase